MKESTEWEKRRKNGLKSKSKTSIFKVFSWYATHFPHIEKSGELMCVCVCKLLLSKSCAKHNQSSMKNKSCVILSQEIRRWRMFVIDFTLFWNKTESNRMPAIIFVRSNESFLPFWLSLRSSKQPLINLAKRNWICQLEKCPWKPTFPIYNTQQKEQKTMF